MRRGTGLRRRTGGPVHALRSRYPHTSKEECCAAVQSRRGALTQAAVHITQAVVLSGAIS